MISPGDDKSFESSLPLSTASQPGEEEPRRKRRTKAEMDASRGKQAPASADPLMEDERYARIVGEMTGLGGKEILSIGFSASGKPLEKSEEKKLDDVFYVMARKGGFNPAQSWIALVIYFLAVLAQLIVARTDLGEKIAEFFKPKPMQPTKETPAQA
jgi:hypothetical protein